MMGPCSAAMACQRSTSSVTWILIRCGLHTFNYFDDFIGVSPPILATSHFNEVGVLLQHLGLEESIDKSCPPSTVMTCRGVKLNTLDITLSVDSDHLAEIENLLHTWLHKRTSTKSSLQSLVGKLVFVSNCIRQSHVFLAWILHLLWSGRFNHHHINLNSEFQKDIQWWCRFLHDNGVSMITAHTWSSPGKVFTTNTCLSGCRGLCMCAFLFSCGVSRVHLHPAS